MPFQVVPDVHFGQWHAAEFVSSADQQAWFHQQADFFAARSKPKPKPQGVKRAAPHHNNKRVVKARKANRDCVDSNENPHTGKSQNRYCHTIPAWHP
jgi:hypothetical protein